MRTVMTFGTFDHFHAGHESYLKQAKALGDYLVVVIARDTTVKSIKGALPDHSEKERLQKVRACGIADKVVLGEKGDKYNVLLRYKPQVIALGYDQFTFTFGLKKFFIDRGMDTKIVRMNPYRPTLYKTSIIRGKPTVSPTYARSDALASLEVGHSRPLPFGSMRSGTHKTQAHAAQ